jgi:hypothetical protein
MSLMMARTRIKEEYADEVEQGVTRAFAAIQRAAPEGVRYFSLRLPDKVTYVILLELADPGDNPLSKVPEFVEFQKQLKDWVAEPGAREELTVVGAYSSI